MDVLVFALCYRNGALLEHACMVHYVVNVSINN